ncbi:hypothetical protein [Bradyrhizobium japonicum]|uniref:hypothetical protein n=1 Tax=Bradyrhizobium japonicum TaxID=375 RepID=UPI0012BC2162|nr:hypothetical protein [Bradyrhizobium japonicum]WLB90695.1 hypothetical protein QIH91_09685 [Bradyrhizobium japonicum USDA 135]
MLGRARGGDDTFTGGNSSLTGSTTFYGDAGGDMSGRAQGGNDAFAGGNSSGPGSTSNILFGDAKSMSGCAEGGDDTLVGGSSSGPGSTSNILFGDAESMSGCAEGGDDILFAGTAAPGGTVSNEMWGDGLLLGDAAGGRDLFVFKDDGPATVGTENTIGDFSQSQHDQIKFSNVAGVHSFNDLVITQSGTDTLVTAGADQVTLHNFAGSLTANDFLFA